MDLKDKLAVITGAGSGVGRELARYAAGQGMQLLLADVDEQGLAETAALLAGAKPVCQRCDVSSPEEVTALADTAFSKFGAVTLLFNNAGVMSCGPIWTSSPQDWQWTLGVNLMGVVHGIQAFVPRMLKQGQPAHIINTASLAGLTSVPGSGAYCASKHGVVSLSECLRHELALEDADIAVSVLCPAFVPTAIADAERHRPEHLKTPESVSPAYQQQVRRAVASGRLSAGDIARMTFEGIAAGEFYILPHKGALHSVAMRMEDILESRQPRDPTRER